jgi:hypothetical protein
MFALQTEIKMNKQFCDTCEKPIAKTDKAANVQISMYEGEVIEAEYSYAKLDKYYTLDLCESCRDIFISSLIANIKQ